MRQSTSSKHLTLVVRKKLFGFAQNVQLVANYGKGIEEVVMHTENYANHSDAVRKANLLSKQLKVEKVAIEE